MARGFTARPDDGRAAELEAVAKAAGVPVAEEISEAIAIVRVGPTAPGNPTATLA